jgi:hypothetical protein
MSLQSTRRKGDAQEGAASGGAIKILSPGGRPSSFKPSKRNAAATPTREEPTKSLLPMKESGQNRENNNNKDSTSKANVSLNLDS